jgi:bacterioferritin (cytochrome b1)
METTTINQLNSFLRDELDAIETYDVALHGRSAFSGKTELSICQRSHEGRATLLRDKIVALGGEPVATAGITGAWHKLVEGGAVALGDDMAIRTLEQGEDHVLRDYRRGLASVEDPEVRSFIERMVLPEEETTHRTMSDLKRQLASS